MNNIPKFFLCENLLLPDSSFVIHIKFPKFMIEFPDERIIWLEDELDEFTKLEHKNILVEAIDWMLSETTKLNDIQLETIQAIETNMKNKFVKNFN